MTAAWRAPACRLAEPTRRGLPQEDAFAPAFPDRRISEVLRAPFSCDDLWFAAV
jgi:hypothetical protein